MRIVLAIGVASAARVSAQTFEAADTTLRSPTEQAAQQRKASFVVMPIPMSNPAIGNGLGVAALAIYRPAGSARPWTTGAGGLYTDTKSWGGAIFQKAYLGGDKYRVTAGAGKGVFNVDFFGIGTTAGSSGRSIPLEQKSEGGVAEVLLRLAPHVHAGLRFRAIKMDTTIKTSEATGLRVDLPDFELQSQVGQLGLSGEFDTRDSEFNPRSGLYANAQWLRADGAFGSDFDYSRLTGAINSYRPMGPKAVLAMRGALCRVQQGAPFYDLCNYGQSNDLRGYTSGQYRDHALVAVQVEYRRKLYKRFGGVVFAGVGEVSSEFGKMNTRDLLPAAGAGLRFEASKAYHVNLAIDYAVGDGSSALYFSVGEAF